MELSLARYNKDAPLIAETIPAIAAHGFRCIDICELHRSPAGGVLQADFLFVKPDLFEALCAQAGARRARGAMGHLNTPKPDQQQLSLPTSEAPVGSMPL